MSKKGVVFIAAAGNMGPTAAPSYPAAYPHVIAVTAVNRDGMNYKSANRGSYIDVSAPGVDVLTALPDAKQGYRTGTSFAVPFVTAILAANIGGVRSAETEKDLLRHVSTRDLGPPGPDPIYGAGLAMAPQRCSRRGAPVANGGTSPSDAWASQTTLIKAGEDLAP
jgi:subtilisin family serine protease